MLREFLIPEALHALGVPTTRSLAVVTTGESPMRDRPEPGAVLARVAKSHIRVGTFEYAARLRADGLVTRLADYATERHHPEAGTDEHPHRAFLDAVVEAQAELIARWMLNGFIHGVMNTDNMTISGEGIDYGPCAFMDRFDPSTVFGSIDHAGRYAYGNQPTIATWNLARLAEALVPLLADIGPADADGKPDAGEAVAIATASLDGFATRYDAHWRAGMQAKLGLLEAPADQMLFADLLEVMHHERLDYTGTFRRLAASLTGDTVAGDTPTALSDWIERWNAQLAVTGRPADEVAASMNAINPLYIPRNHLVDEALNAATDGDLAPFERLLDIVTQPFEERSGLERFAEPAPDEFNARFRTFCGT